MVADLNVRRKMLTRAMHLLEQDVAATERAIGTLKRTLADREMDLERLSVEREQWQSLIDELEDDEKRELAASMLAVPDAPASG